MAGRAAATSGVGTAAGAAATGDVDPALEMLTDGGGAGEEGEEGEELIFDLQKNRLATAGDGKRLLGAYSSLGSKIGSCFGGHTVT